MNDDELLSGADDLNQYAMWALAHTFQKWDHVPSVKQIDALLDLQGTLTECLFGTASDSFFLSSPDCGVGKTTAVASWLSAYLANQDSYCDQGVIISLDRLEQIEDFIRDSIQDVPESSYAIMVGDSTQNGKGREMNQRGTTRVDEAVILFTTKAMVNQRAKGRPFDQVEDMFYKGKPRQVKIWDESLIVGDFNHIEVNEVSHIGSILSGLSSSTAQRLKDEFHQFTNELTQAATNSYLVPMFGYESTDNFLSDYRDAIKSNIWGKELKVAMDRAKQFTYLMGQTVGLHNNRSGATILTIKYGIPENFTPCLVTDASGRLRETYLHQESYRGDLVRLKEAPKSYRDLTIHHWKRGAGGSHYRKKGMDDTAIELYHTIIQKPDQEWLILHFKDHSPEAKLAKSLRENGHHKLARNIKYIHWGIHTAVNDYAHIPNICIIAQFYQPSVVYEGTLRAAATLKPEDGELDADTLKRFARYEIAHHLLQGACRSAIRKSCGDACVKTDLYIIGSEQYHIDESLLLEVFPEANYRQWELRPQTMLNTNSLKAHEYLLEATDSEIKGVKVREAIGVTNISNFKRDVLTDERFLSLLPSTGYRLDTTGHAKFLKVDA